jgi:formylglycine-generating enzyme required for sulfatase activity
VTRTPKTIDKLQIPLIQLTEDTSLAAWPTRLQDFAAFIAATGYDATGNMLTLGKDDFDWLPHGHTWESPGFAQTPDHPVVGVSYHDAVAFCAWLTEQERLSGNIDSRQSYGLPTDLEWSLAVGLRQEEGGSPEERLYRSQGTYPWGPAWPPPPNFGNYAGAESRRDMPSWWGVVPGGYVDPFPRTSPVASFAPNHLGLYDLSGNVWEWCADAYCPGSLARVIRGGSWGSDRPAYLQSANRIAKFPDSRNDETGFRIALHAV